LFGVFSVPPVGGADPPKDDKLSLVLGKMKEADGALVCFEAAFKETCIDAILHDEEISQGRLFYKKPDRVKWIYEEPAKKEFVLREKEVWLYIPKINQVQKIRLTDQKKLEALPVGLGKSPEESASRYEVKLLESLEEEGKTIYRLLLVPKEDPQAVQPFQKIVLDIEDGVWLPARRIELAETSGNRTIIELSSIKKKKDLNENLFKMPKGVEVVDYSK